MVSGSAKRALSSSARAVSPPAKRKVQSSTTKTAVASFFTPASQKPPQQTTFRVVDNSLLIASHKPENFTSEPRSKIAGFDLDGTLIKTRSGNKFAKSEGDWQWWHDSVPDRLRKLHDDGYRIMVFTNQGGLKEPSKNTKNFQQFKGKVSLVLEQLGLPVVVYAATTNDRYRKPRGGMWELMLEDLGSAAASLEKTESYLVGDAAGREGDFADSDWHWAMNIGIGFKTPEEFFLGEEKRPQVHRFDPAAYISPDGVPGTAPFPKGEEKEMVVFVGSPAAGKSTFYWGTLRPLGYERINQDLLKTKAKCAKVAAAALEDGKSVCIDNTNADVATREAWIALAKKYKVPVRCVWFTAPPQVCKHNDTVRGLNEALNPEKRTTLPGIAFNSYASRFQEPKLEEGFGEIIKLDFQWQGKPEEREIWSKFWI